MTRPKMAALEIAMRVFFWSGVVLMVLSGCVSVNKQQLSSSQASGLKDQSVAATSRKVPDFSAMTPGKAMFGMIGAAAMISEGNKLISTHKVADPADAIAQNLNAALAGKHGTQLAKPIAMTAEDPGTMADTVAGQARFVLDVQTINWTLLYFPTNWAKYRLLYTAKARLIDVKSKQVVAEGFCKHLPESDVGAPSYDEFLANEASRLKQELDLAANGCTQSLKAEMLAI